MLKVLGRSRYEFFFDRWLTYFFTAQDAEFFASLGLNCIRIPFNHRHLEDDMNPRVLKTEGFRHLDRVIELCAAEGIYTILDMHTVPGGQNPDWHSDNPTNWAGFWDYRDHQDRTVWLWERIAERYRGNAWVAGYNPINEPCDAEHCRLPAFYDRIEKAIRAVDADHILWLDGNTFVRTDLPVVASQKLIEIRQAMEWKHFDHILPNSVYALHDYSTMGFPTGEPFTNSPSQTHKLETQFKRKAAFMSTHQTPIWNGEFGPVYANPRLDADASSTNESRYALLGAQLQIYSRYRIHWSVWLYKDIGVQGMVYTDPDSAWNRLLQPFLDKKRELQLDAWGKHPSPEAQAAVDPMVRWIDKVAPGVKELYPTPWATERQVLRATLQTLVARSFDAEFAELFRGKSEEELDELARSFAFERCLKREGLNRIMMEHAKMRGDGKEEGRERIVVDEAGERDDLP